MPQGAWIVLPGPGTWSYGGQQFRAGRTWTTDPACITAALQVTGVTVESGKGPAKGAPAHQPPAPADLAGYSPILRLEDLGFTTEDLVKKAEVVHAPPPPGPPKVAVPDVPADEADAGVTMSPAEATGGDAEVIQFEDPPPKARAQKGSPKVAR